MIDTCIRINYFLKKEVVDLFMKHV